MNFKQIILILLIWLLYCGQTIGAYTYISSDVLQDGQIFDYSHTFSDKVIEFSLIDKNISGEWHIEMKTTDGHYLSLPFDASDKGCCVFDPAAVDWKRAIKKYDAQLNRYIFELTLYFKAYYTYPDSKIVRFALMPSRPIIDNISYSYEYDWEHNYICPNSDLSFTVISEDSDGFCILSTPTHQFSMGSFIIREPIDGYGRVEVSYDADWGEYICIEAYNKYGSILGDTICSTDYINDERILQRIDELKAQSFISTIQQDSIEHDINISICDNTIKFDHIVLDTCIYDLLGNCHMSLNNIDLIDISGLSKGCYILLYKCADSTTNIFKFIRP